MKKETWKRLGLMALVFALNYGLDRLTKLLAVARLKGTGVHEYLGGLLVLVFAENDGAFLSMGSTWPPAVKMAVFLLLPFLVCLYGLWYALVREKRCSTIVIIVTIVAGGIGNLQDRLLNNFRVVDFLNVGIGNFRTGILNVGDMSVTFGVIALALSFWLAERQAGGGSAASAKTGGAGHRGFDKDGRRQGKGGGRPKK